MKLKALIITWAMLFSTTCHALTNACFSPSTCCEDNIVELTNDAKETIDIAIFSFTNKRIYNAILNAKQRGVAIRIVTDRGQSKTKDSLIQTLEENGLNVRVQKKFRIEHNKFAVFDGKTMITGSYNWTGSATKKNSENCLLEYRPEIVEQYSHRFQYLWDFYGQKNNANHTKFRRGRRWHKQRQQQTEAVDEQLIDKW